MNKYQAAKKHSLCQRFQLGLQTSFSNLVECVNFSSEWRDLRLKIDYETARNRRLESWPHGIPLRNLSLTFYFYS